VGVGRDRTELGGRNCGDEDGMELGSGPGAEER